MQPYPAFRWFVLSALLIGTIANGVILIWPAPLMQHIAEALHADLGAVIGVLMVAFTILVSVFALIGGICLDRFGLLPTMLVSLGVMTVATLLLPLCSHSFGAAAPQDRRLPGFANGRGPGLAGGFRGLAGFEASCDLRHRKKHAKVQFAMGVQ